MMSEVVSPKNDETIDAEDNGNINENVNHRAKKYRVLSDSDAVAKDLERAKREWDNFDDTELSEHDELDTLPPIVSTPLITFEEVMEYFKSCDMSEYMAHIVPVVPQSRLMSFLRLVLGPPYLNSTLEQNRNLLFAIAGCPLKNNESIHMRVLQTIYKQLTNSKNDVSRYGPHWDFVGFQGNDPATDLRGVGFLGLMHLLYMVTNPATVILARRILKLSHHCTQNFPFSVMGINITRIVLQTLREEKLNKECNKRKDVIGVTNEFYLGVFLHLYEIWRKNGVTIADSGWVLKGVENDAKRRPKFILQELEQYLKNSKQDELIKINPPAISCAAEETPKICHMKPYPMKDIDTNFINIVTECNSDEKLSAHDNSFDSHGDSQEFWNNKRKVREMNNVQTSNQEVFV